MPGVTQDRGVSDPTPTGRRTGRLGQTVGDMTRSLIVVLAVVAAILLVTWRPQPDAVKVVDVEPFVSAVGTQADFGAVRLPAELTGYRPTSARWEPTSESDGLPVWFVGYVMPNEQYLQVSQSRAASVDYLREQTAGGALTGSVDIDGVTWQRYETPDRRSLVLADDATTVVSGTASWDDLLGVVRQLAPISR